MAQVTELIKAIASLLWPVLGFLILFSFKSEISDLLRRLKRGKMLGQEIELSESLRELHVSAQAAEEAVAALPIGSVQKDQINEADDVVQLILTESARSPRSALLLLASHIEREARRGLAKVGLLQGRDDVPASQAVMELQRQYGGLPGDVVGSLRLFWDVRNRIIHGGSATDEDILSALDSGITILRTLISLPSEVNLVAHPGVDVFSDPSLRAPIDGVKGVILESSGPGGIKKFRRIFPTTRTHFVPGQRVAWEWNSSRVWREAWYRDPEDGQIKSAWSSASEFIGRPLKDL